jgi:arylsulfatase A
MHSLFVRFCAFSLSLVSWAQVHAATKPNIVFILADDLGYAEISANGADHYKTPHIDALAQGGVRFSHFYTAPLCGPSRALILTGRYGFRSGAVTQDACGTMVRTGEKAEIMAPVVLKKAGYTTAMIGKWGQILPAGDAAEWGFDHVMSFKASGIYWNKAAAGVWVQKYQLKGDKDGEGGVRAKPGPYHIDGKQLTLSDSEYMPDLLHADAVSFVNANKEKPFFLYYSMSHVHSQILPTPDSAPPDLSTDAAARELQLYSDNISYMDKLVGKLVAELDRLKLRENTVIFFMGDNGTGKAHAERATIGGRRMVGQKGGMEEGGGHVPFIVSWPGVTPAGRQDANFTDASDLLPTFAEIAGAPLPEKRVIDGQSLLPQIKGNSAAEHNWAFTQLGGHWHVREAGWKLDETGQLFDMRNAPFEEIPVPADTQDTEAQSSRQRLTKILAQLNPAAGIRGEGDGRGDKTGKPSTSTPPANADQAERGVKFDKLDEKKAGKLTREYYTTHQSDAAAAGERFDKYDTDKDGFVTRAEYLLKGKKAEK